MKKFKLIVGAMALFALVVANVWNAATTFQETELKVTDVENIAVGDPIESLVNSIIGVLRAAKTQRLEVIPCSGQTTYVTKYYTPFYYEQEHTVKWQGTEAHCHELSKSLCWEYDCIRNN